MTQHARFYSDFDRALEKKKLLYVGDRDFIVQWDEECVKKYGRFGKIIDMYPNPNTGNTVYVYEYEKKIFGPDRKMFGDNYWAREIITGDCRYSIWTPCEKNDGDEFHEVDEDGSSQSENENDNDEGYGEESDWDENEDEIIV